MASRTRRSPDLPRLLARAAPAAAVAALGYGALQLAWALGRPPAFGRFGTDLLVFPRWGAVLLCAAAAPLAAAVGRAGRPRLPLLLGAWLVSGALLVCCPFLLLDAVGLALPGMRIPFNLPGLLSRAACAAVAGLLALAALGYRRRAWGDCPRCGRTGAPHGGGPAARPPRGAWWAAYGAVACCWLRIAAQYGLGLGSPGPVQPARAASLAVFEAGFLLAGTALPLSLVHRWGRTVPQRVPLLGGRAVPRLLVLLPAVLVSAGLLVYFGVGIGQLTAETLHPHPARPGDLPHAFLWVAMPAYWCWGLGLALAAVSFHRRTRTPCPDCGR
ncbi:hypothetical protein ACFW1A_39710 [Kitasatospora sp. NPDC058965]|uniref:hypothetical protein n=1 Tax=Kitasatospora sp. NPDC058965 TaxID=3346682 RepID=UPI0036BD23B2